MRLLVFLHGTVLVHAGGVGVIRAERVAQVRAKHPTVREYAAYVPVGEAVAKLRRWQDAGAVDYLSSHGNPDDVALDALVLRTHGFPAGQVFARRPGESYGDVAGREAPDVLIEDDCESIGADQVTYLQIPPAVRDRIKSIIIPRVRWHRPPPRRPPSPANFRALSMRNARSWAFRLSPPDSTCP
jgi:hypothetical protein